MLAVAVTEAVQISIDIDLWKLNLKKTIQLVNTAKQFNKRISGRLGQELLNRNLNIDSIVTFNILLAPIGGCLTILATAFVHNSR